MIFTLRRALGLAVAVALAVLPAVPVRAADPIVVYGIFSLTGPGAFIGQADMKSVRLALDLANKQGGIRGRPLELQALDDQSSPQTAVSLTGSLVGKTQFIVGPATTAPCAAIGPMLRTGPVSYCLSPGILPAAGSFAFSAGNNNDDNVAALVRYFRERGWKRVALITSTDASGQAVDRGILYALNLLENRGMQLVAQEHFGLGDVSATAQMERIKAAKPDAVIAWANGTPFGTLLRGIQDVGLTVPLGASSGNLIYALLKQFGPLLPRETYFPGGNALTPLGDENPREHAAQARFYQAFAAAGTRPDQLSVIAWDPVMIFIDALKALGPDASAEKIRAYIASLHGWVGISGTYDFRDGSQRGIGQDSCIIQRYDTATDKIVPVSRPAGFLDQRLRTR